MIRISNKICKKHIIKIEYEENVKERVDELLFDIETIDIVKIYQSHGKYIFQIRSVGNFSIFITLDNDYTECNNCQKLFDLFTLNTDK